MKPTLSTKEGDDYIVGWEMLDFGLHFSRIRETDSSIKSLATPVTLSDRKRLMAPAWINLFTIADRERLAKAIAERVEGKDAPLLADWKDSVEHAFAEVIDLHTQSEPLDNLASIEERDDDGVLIGPSVLLRNQINVLLADQKSGKSYDALLLCVAVATGRQDLLPAPMTLSIDEPAPVIYYDAETDKYTQRRRLERVCAGLRLPRLPEIHYRHLVPPLADRASLMRADIDRIGAVMVVIDSLTYAAGGELNSLEVSVPTMNAIGELGPNVTKLVTAHHGKGARANGAKPSIIGSAGFEFKARNIWILRKEENKGEDVMEQAWEHGHINDGRQERGFGLRLEFDRSNTILRFRSVSIDESQFVAQYGGTDKDKVRAALLNTEFLKADIHALAKMTNLEERRVLRAATQMEDVRKVAGGRGAGNLSVFEMVDAVRPERPSRNGHSPVFQPENEEWAGLPG